MGFLLLLKNFRVLGSIACSQASQAITSSQVGHSGSAGASILPSVTLDSSLTLCACLCVWYVSFRSRQMSTRAIMRRPMRLSAWRSSAVCGAVSVNRLMCASCYMRSVSFIYAHLYCRFQVPHPLIYHRNSTVSSLGFWVIKINVCAMLRVSMTSCDATPSWPAPSCRPFCLRCVSSSVPSWGRDSDSFCCPVLCSRPAGIVTLWLCVPVETLLWARAGPASSTETGALHQCTRRPGVPPGTSGKSTFIKPHSSIYFVYLHL